MREDWVTYAKEAKEYNYNRLHSIAKIWKGNRRREREMAKKWAGLVKKEASEWAVPNESALPDIIARYQDWISSYQEPEQTVETPKEYADLIKFMRDQKAFVEKRIETLLEWKRIIDEEIDPYVPEPKPVSEIHPELKQKLIEKARADNIARTALKKNKEAEIFSAVTGDTPEEIAASMQEANTAWHKFLEEGLPDKATVPWNFDEIPEATLDEIEASL